MHTITPNLPLVVETVLYFSGTSNLPRQSAEYKVTKRRSTQLNSTRTRQLLQVVGSSPPLALLTNAAHNSFLDSGGYDAEVRLWDLKSQNRQPIQILDEARDAIQCLHIGGSYIVSGSVDGRLRTYDLRMGELRVDFLGRESSALHKMSSHANEALQNLSLPSYPHKMVKQSLHARSTRQYGSWIWARGRC